MFTVAVTPIIRGTIQHARIATDFTQSQNIGWVYFWISIEFAASGPRASRASRRTAALSGLGYFYPTSTRFHT